MNKMIIGLSVVIVLAFGWLAFQGSTTGYVATIDDEVTQLETELAQTEADIQAGTLTPDEATVVRAALAVRLDKINVAVEESQSKNLSSRQQAVLVDGLARLKDILVKYQSTLNFVENTATVKPPLSSSKGKTRNTVAAVMSETILAVEQTAIQVVDDYVPYIPETIEVEEPVVEVEEIDSNSTTTEEVGTSTEETTDEEVEGDGEESTIISGEVEVDAETEVEMNDDDTTTEEPVN